MLTLNFTTVSGGSMGKAPMLKVGDLVLQESGENTQFLVEKLHTLDYLLPKSRNRRASPEVYARCRYVALRPT